MAPPLQIHPGKLEEIGRVESAATALGDVAEAIQLLLGHLADLTGAGAVVDLEQDGSLVSCFSTAGAEHELGHVQHIDRSLAALCFSNGDILRSPNIHRDPRFTVPAGGSAVVSMVGVPLYVHGRTVGVVRLVAASESCFNDEDVSVARSLTGSIARVLMLAVRKEIRGVAGSDPATSANQIERFADRRKVELRQADQYGYPVTILNCTLKGYVDGEVLHQLSELVRSTDECFRLDAAEFAIMMPGTSLSDGHIVGARLAKAVETASDEVCLEWDVRPLSATGWDAA